ncbi:MAG TPA: beta-1,6-N-acetylglucosaminyltransferase [Waterburya sp.]|jgi:hypothetical protein
MKVLYLIQTHQNPDQIYRLVQIIKTSSPRSYILISHSYNYSYLDASPFLKFPGVEVISRQGGRGNFSLTRGYLEALDWIFSHNIEFDWLINLSGQDYPTQPLPKIENFLESTKYDGFLVYFDALSDSKQNPWGSKLGKRRYLYQYLQLSESLSFWQQAIMKPLQEVINHMQSLVYIHSSYGLRIGIPAYCYPFNAKFLCYGGSFFSTLSQKTVQYLYNFSKHNPQFVDYYKKLIIPEESYVQTVLVNSQRFNLCNENKRYYDFSKTKLGHPRLLTIEDYPALIKDDIHFARKFDMTQDSKVLDWLDARILQV